MSEQDVKVLTSPERCKQCELCVVNCPKKCISFSIDTEQSRVSFYGH